MNVVTLTEKWWRVRDERDALTLLLLAFAFFLPIGISVAQFFAYLAIPVWLLCLKRGALPNRWRSPFVWPIALFVVFVIVAALAGPRPEFTIPRSRRFLMLTLVFAIGGVFELAPRDPRRSVLAPLVLFLMGATCLGLWDVVRVPVQVAQGVGLYDAGNMRDPQLYMVSACVILALWIYRPVRFPPLWLACVTVINLVGMVLHFKRGVWISLLLTSVLVVAMTRRFRLLATIGLGVAVLFAIPATRARIGLLHEEIQEVTGGRLVLWTRVAPAMLNEHPLGVGFRGFAHEDFVAYSPVYLQPGLNHLHNNVLQVAVDFGWLGAAVWVGWMALALWVLFRQSRACRREDPVRAAAGLACLSGFVGLMINGMVEYNFGNSVIFMVFLWLMGLATALHQSRCTEPAAE